MVRFSNRLLLSSVLARGMLATLPAAMATAATVGNPLCPGEDVQFTPSGGQDIVVPSGFKVEVFKTGLNFPTGIAFLGSGKNFEVFILESGHGLPSRCNDEALWQTKGLGPNPFTPDVLVFNQNGALLRTLGKPTDATTETGGTNVFQPHGPAVDLAFENGLAGGRLVGRGFEPGTHRHNAPNNSTPPGHGDPLTGAPGALTTQLPTAEHPTREAAF